MSLLGSVVSGLGNVISSVTGGTSTATSESSSSATSSTTSVPSTTESTTASPTTTPTPTSTTSSPTTSAPSTPTPTSTTDAPTTTETPTTSSPSTTSPGSDSSTTAPSTTTAVPAPTSTTMPPTTTTASSSSDTGSSSSDSHASASAVSESSFSSTATASSDGRSASSSTTASISATASSTDAANNGRGQSGSSSTKLRGQSGSDSSAGVYSDGSSGYGSLATGGVQHGSQGLSAGPIVGISVGALAVVLLVVLLVFWRRRRGRQPRHSSMSTPTLDFCYTSSPVNLTMKPGISERFDTSSTGLFTSYRKAKLEAAHVPEVSEGSPLAKTSMWADQIITALRIPFDKLTRTTLVNRGGYGEVYLGSYHGQRVAIKTLLPDKRKDLDEINAFLAEIRMMASIEHERIVHFIGVAWDQLTDLCAVSEFMVGGDLRSLLKHFEVTEKRRHGFDADKARIALQVAHALTYLHSLEPVVLHRDLKSRNILLTANMEAKLTDFGVSRKYTFSTMTAGVGTPLWMAPEVMLGARYDASADIFSLGVVLSELDTQQVPYAESKLTISGRKVPPPALLQLVSSGLMRVEFSPNAPQALVELGHACVALDPAARPSAREVLYQLQMIHEVYEKYTI